MTPTRRSRSASGSATGRTRSPFGRSKLGRMRPRHFSFGALLVATGCGATQLGVANYEDPRTTGGSVHQHNDETIGLPDDESVTEPEHPMVQTVQERATAHVHTPKDICSGVVIGPK